MYYWPTGRRHLENVKWLTTCLIKYQNFIWPNCSTGKFILVRYWQRLWSQAWVSFCSFQFWSEIFSFSSGENVNVTSLSASARGAVTIWPVFSSWRTNQGQPTIRPDTMTGPPHQVCLLCKYSNLREITSHYLVQQTPGHTDTGSK